MPINDQELLDLLVERENYLKKILANRKKQNEKLTPQLQGKLCVKKHGRSYQYFLREKPQDKDGRYLSKHYKHQVQQLLQREYNDNIIDTIDNELHFIEMYIQNASPINVNNVYKNLYPGRKELVNPVEIDVDAYVAHWESVTFKGKSFSDDAPEFYTEKGERVRSKSEKIIADTLYKNNIPYRYEFPTTIKDIGVVYPDFTALNIRKRKEVIIEHLGLMDEHYYVEKALRKIEKYQQTGYYLGDNFLITFESHKQQLNTMVLEDSIKRMLL